MAVPAISALKQRVISISIARVPAVTRRRPSKTEVRPFGRSLAFRRPSRRPPHRIGGGGASTNWLTSKGSLRGSLFRAWWCASVTRPRRDQGGFPWGLGRAGNRGRTNSSRACRVSSTIFDRAAERARQVGVMETIAMIGGKKKMRDISGSCHSGTKDLSERVRRGPASGAISA
jgi:hypothetical protein